MWRGFRVAGCARLSAAAVAAVCSPAAGLGLVQCVCQQRPQLQRQGKPDIGGRHCVTVVAGSWGQHLRGRELARLRATCPCCVYRCWGERGEGARASWASRGDAQRPQCRSAAPAISFAGTRPPVSSCWELPQSELTPGLQNQSSSSCSHKLLRHQATSSASPGDQQ